MKRAARRGISAQDIAIEIVRRANAGHTIPPYVIRVSRPPTRGEQLQLLAARLERRPIVIMPHKCARVDEWLATLAR